MKKITFFVLMLLVISGQAQSNQKFNLGFEKQSNANALPDGWFQLGGYVLSIDSISYSGQNSGKITSTGYGNFGSIAFKIPASYTGKAIKLEGYMKIKNVVNGFAGLLLRIDDANNQLIVFDNMHENNISGTKEWQKYSIEINYPPEAKNIIIGGFLAGEGEAWFDDFELTIDEESVQTLKETEQQVYTGPNVEIPELTTGLINDLVLLGKVWGFLKYYHPKVAKGNYNWDDELFYLLPEYLDKRNNIKREELILQWIDDLGKIDKCKTCKSTSADAPLKPDLEWITNSINNKALRNTLHYIYKNRNQGDNFYVRMIIPAGKPEFTNEPAYANIPYPDNGLRLLAIYRYWNIINYFFPYKHLIDKDWDEILKEYIPKFLQVQNELDYKLVVLQLIAEVCDTHANLLGENKKIEEWKGRYFAPVHLRFVEGKLVVTDYYNPELKNETGLEIGDVITKIDGKAVEDIVAELSKFYPASNEPTRLRNISADLLRSRKSEVEIEYVQNESKKTKMLQLYSRRNLNIYQWYHNDDERSYRFLENNIGYITLKTIKNEDIPEIKKHFINTKGIIIDIRNYPSVPVRFSLGSFFVSSSTPFVKLTRFNIDNPGEFTFSKDLEMFKSEKTYKGKLIVIVNELTQSQAEFTAMAFKAGDNTTIIGSTTAGADGDISIIELPGGLKTAISGIGVYYPDGEETQRIGIIPDIVVKPTIEGIKNGKDELLEKAIEIILKE